MKKIFLLLIVFTSFQNQLATQNDFYNIDTIQEIRIYFEQENWDHILDSLYIDGQKERLLASININGTQLDSIGIRYKGFSSVSTDRKKNPFNIKLDYVNNDQQYDGIDKIKLSNVIQDPSFIREVLSYEIARKYMPAPRSNFANVFINDTLWGLYTNVEAINKAFLRKLYGSNQNSFFKCNPESLDLDGENSNLNNSHGTDSTDYAPYYDMRSDYGWADLYQLIDILNEQPDNIESILNVDRTLWMHAFNYVLVNFDSYIGYAQNYYLYKDDNGRFNPIIWDLNMSFASYRFSDASEHWDGFSIDQAKTIDPLLHHSSVSVSPRPLMRNLFENDTYRRMFLAHMRTILEENFSNQNYLTRGQYLQDLIDEAVFADENKFYGYDDFQNNLTSTVSDLIDYPGIAELMDARGTYLNDYPGFQNAPTISNLNYTPQDISIGENIWITAMIENASEVTLAYRFGGNGLFQKVNMLDDGSQNDGNAGDGIYGIQLTDLGNSIQYYIYAENDQAGRFSPEKAAFEHHTILSDINVGDIVINEFMASNDATYADEEGEYDDWIELYNTTDFDISTAGLYLSDNPDNLDKWALPDVIIPADGYLIIWADEDGSQGDLHANFKLSADGETIHLAYEDGEVIDSVIFGAQTTDVATGRYPNGTGPFQELFPTPNAINMPTSVEEAFLNTSFKIFPNPASEQVFVEVENGLEGLLEIRTLNGQLLKRATVDVKTDFLHLNIAELSNGVYYISLLNDDFIVTKKLILLN